MLKEFKEFIMTGNVIEFAVAVIMAGAVGAVGAVGATGAVGAVGAVGATGAVGAVGAKGMLNYYYVIVYLSIKCLI